MAFKATNGNNNEASDVIYPNYYVVLKNADEEKEIHTSKGAFKGDFGAVALEIIKKDPSRLMSRPTLSDGTKLFVDDRQPVDTSGWS